MIRKFFIVRVILVSIWFQSCGSLIVPAVEAAHAARLKRAALAKKGGEEVKKTAKLDGEVPFKQVPPYEGKEESDITPVVSFEVLDGPSSLETYSEIDGKIVETPAETGIQPAGDEGILLVMDESGVVEESSPDEILVASARMTTTVETMMEEPGLEEKTVKAPTTLELTIKKLVAAAGIKKPKKITVVHPPGETGDLVMLWCPRTAEALILDALEGTQGEVYQPALEAAKHFMAEPKQGDVTDMAPKLVRLLYEMARSFDNILFVTSGYRKPGGHTKPTSYHTKGMAADVKHPLVDGCDLRDFAVAWGAGGVGFYPASNSIHMDVRDSPYYWVGLPGKNKIVADPAGYWTDKYR
jgi:hypothetical protein